jgi:hypothetical protein
MDRHLIISSVLMALAACGRSADLGSPAKTADLAPPAGTTDLALPVAAADLARTDGPAADLTVSCAAATPSRQIVHVTVENASAADRWLATQGQYCDPFAVSNLTLSLGYICGCECPAPPAAAATYYVYLASGQSTRFDWDARALDDCTQTVDCSMSRPPIMVADGRLQPLGAGEYTLTVAYERSAPSAQGCVKHSNGDYQCFPPWSPGNQATPIASLCASGATARAPLTLPPSGPVSITVALD